jgi:beta-lactamase class A
VYDFQSGEVFGINQEKRFRMQSVYKFHLALAVLNRVDKGELSLDQPIVLKERDLLQETWSPISDKYKAGDTLLLSEVIRYTVSLSDNSGCDILFRLLGGPSDVNDYIHSTGVTDVAITSTEEVMQKDWEEQFKNWTTPAAAVKLLNLFYKKQILSAESFNYLWNVMVKTETGAKRLKGLLPEGTIVAHKTGTSGMNDNIIAAVNDIGIVTLPDNRSYAIALFVSESKEGYDGSETIIAEVSKKVWDYFNKEKE